MIFGCFYERGVWLHTVCNMCEKEGIVIDNRISSSTKKGAERE